MILLSQVLNFVCWGASLRSVLESLLAVYFGEQSGSHLLSRHFGYPRLTFCFFFFLLHLQFLSKSFIIIF